MSGDGAREAFGVGIGLVEQRGGRRDHAGAGRRREVERTVDPVEAVPARFQLQTCSVGGVGDGAALGRERVLQRNRRRPRRVRGGVRMTLHRVRDDILLPGVERHDRPAHDRPARLGGHVQTARRGHGHGVGLALRRLAVDRRLRHHQVVGAGGERGRLDAEAAGHLGSAERDRDAVGSHGEGGADPDVVRAGPGDIEAGMGGVVAAAGGVFDVLDGGQDGRLVFWKDADHDRGDLRSRQAGRKGERVADGVRCAGCGFQGDDVVLERAEGRRDGIGAARIGRAGADDGGLIREVAERDQDDGGARRRRAGQRDTRVGGAVVVRGHPAVAVGGEGRRGEHGGFGRADLVAEFVGVDAEHVIDRVGAGGGRKLRRGLALLDPLDGRDVVRGRLARGRRCGSSERGVAGRGQQRRRRGRQAGAGRSDRGRRGQQARQRGRAVGEVERAGGRGLRHRGEGRVERRGEAGPGLRGDVVGIDHRRVHHPGVGDQEARVARRRPRDGIECREVGGRVQAQRRQQRGLRCRSGLAGHCGIGVQQGRERVDHGRAGRGGERAGQRHAGLGVRAAGGDQFAGRTGKRERPGDRGAAGRLAGIGHAVAVGIGEHGRVGDGSVGHLAGQKRRARRHHRRRGDGDRGDVGGGADIAGRVGRRHAQEVGTGGNRAGPQVEIAVAIRGRGGVEPVGHAIHQQADAAVRLSGAGDVERCAPAWPASTYPTLMPL